MFFFSIKWKIQSKPSAVSCICVPTGRDTAFGGGVPLKSSCRHRCGRRLRVCCTPQWHPAGCPPPSRMCAHWNAHTFRWVTCSPVWRTATLNTQVYAYLLGLNMLDSWKQWVASGWEGRFRAPEFMLTLRDGFMAAEMQDTKLQIYTDMCVCKCQTDTHFNLSIISRSMKHLLEISICIDIKANSKS